MSLPFSACEETAGRNADDAEYHHLNDLSILASKCHTDALFAIKISIQDEEIRVSRWTQA